MGVPFDSSFLRIGASGLVLGLDSVSLGFGTALGAGFGPGFLISAGFLVTGGAGFLEVVVGFEPILDINHKLIY